jgi:tetratricopeptide (TPR) repeat protein
LATLFFKALKIQGNGDILASLVAGCCCSLLLTFGVLSVKHMAVWKDSFAFWNRVIDVVPSTGSAYLFRGREYASKQDYQKALQDIDTALAIAQQKQAVNAFHEIYAYRGRTLLLARQDREAVEAFNHAIETSSFEKRGTPVQEYYMLRDLALNRLRRQNPDIPLAKP